MSSLPCFMDLTFQVPMKYCSLQLQCWLSPPDTSTTEHCFRFGPATSFYLELLVVTLCSAVVAYYTPFWPGGLIFQCRIFLPSHTIHGVLEAGMLEWFAIPSSTGPRFVRTLHCNLLILVALHGMTHGFFSVTWLWSMKGLLVYRSSLSIITTVLYYFVYMYRSLPTLCTGPISSF